MSVAGSLTIAVKPDMTGFSNQVAGQATAAGTAASQATGNAFTKGLTRNAGAVKSAGRNMTMGLSAPLTLIGALSVRAAAKFESSMSMTAQALDKPMSSMGALKQQALDLGNSTIFSAGEVGDAMTELAKGGFSEAEIAGGALESTLSLAAAGGIELTSAAQDITAAMNTFGIEAKDSATIADALAGAANASAADVGELAWSLNSVGSVANLADQKLADVTGTLAALADRGIKGSTAGTTIRSVLTTLIKPTEQAQAAMDKYGLSFKDAEGNMKSLPAVAGELQRGFEGVSQADRNLALVSIFGTFGIRGAKVMMEEGTAGLKRYADASREVGTAQKAAYARMGPSQRALEELSGAWETFMITVGDALAPVVSKVAQGLNKLLEAFSGLPKGVQTAAVAFGALVIAAGPVLYIAGSLAGAISKIKAFSGASKALCAAGSGGLGGCMGQLPGVAGNASKGAGAVSRLGTALKTAAGGVGLVGGGWIAAGLALAAFIAYQQQSNAETQKQIGKTKEFGEALATAKSRPLASPTGDGSASMDRAALTAAKILTDQAEATGMLTNEQTRLNQAQTQYSQQLQASNTIITQRNNGTLKGAALTKAATGALQEQVNKSRGLSEAMVANQSSAADVMRTVTQQKNAFMNNAVAMGFNKKQAAILAKSMDLIPKNVKTYIKAQNAEETENKVNAIDKRLAALQRRKTAIKVNSNDPDEAARKINNVDKKIGALNRQKARIKAEAKEIDNAASKIDKLKGKLASIKPKEVEVIADTVKADTSLKKTEQLLAGLEKRPYEPDVTVQNDAAEVAGQVNQTLDAIPDEEVVIRTIREYTGDGGKDGDPATAEWTRGGNNQDDSQVRGFSLNRPRNRNNPLAPPKKNKKDKAAKIINAPTPAGQDPGNPWADLIASYPIWAAQLASANVETRLAAANAMAAAEAQAQRIEENATTAYQRSQEDLRRAQETIWNQQTRAAGTKLAEKQKALDDLRSVDKKDRNEKAIAKAEKKQAKARKKQVRVNNRVSKEQLEFSRQQEDQATRRARAANAFQTIADAAQTAAEERRAAAAAAQEETDRAAAEAADAAAQAAAEKAEAEKQAAAELLASQEAAADAITSRQKQTAETLSSVPFQKSATATIRSLVKQASMLKSLGTNMSRLASAGLSKDAILAMGKMDPADAKRLADRLLANPSLIGQLNSAYQSTLTEAANVSNLDTAAWAGTGTAMTNGILAGLQQGGAGVLNYIKTLGANALAALRDVLGISSPSKEFALVGTNIGLGLVRGMESMESRVAMSAGNLVSIPRARIPAGVTRGGDGGAVVVNVYPTPGQSEAEVAHQVSRELAWSM